MSDQKQVRVTELESKEDLDLLVRGDVVNRFDPFDSYPTSDWETVAFHRINDVGHYEFLFPAFMRDKYIIMDKVRKSRIQVKDGKIIYDRDGCAIESFSQSDSRYADLNRTLQMAGLR
jgi:hypothetical protein